MKPPPDSALRQHCEELFAAFLERFHAGQTTLEEFCAQHPAEASRLEALWAQLVELGEVADPAAEPVPAAAAAQLGGFRLVREIGRGGMGIVYEAEDLELRRRVALKMLPEDLRRSSSARERFEREIAALAPLSHPHIVPVHRAGIDRGRPYLVMEYIEGASLQALLDEIAGASSGRTGAEQLLAIVRAHCAAGQGGPASGADRSWTEMIARLAAETAEALEHAHQHGVLHRDVKPSNILIDLHGQVRLVDFGVAKVAGEASLTVPGGFAGTLSYAAPEQLSRAAAQLDGRADVYALGIVLYRLLTGELPFEGEDTHALLRRILTEVPREPRRTRRDIPWELSVICSRAIEKRPGERYPSAAALAADLRAFLAHRPIVARPPGRVRRACRTAQRHPWGSALVLVLVMGLAASGIGMVVRERIARRRAAAEMRQRLAGMPRELEKLRGTGSQLEERLKELQRLRYERYNSRLDEKKRARFLELPRLVERLRKRFNARLGEILYALRAASSVLGEEAVRPAQERLGLDMLAFWRRTRKERETSLAEVMNFLDLPLRDAALQDRVEGAGRFRVSVEPADAELFLFRYLDETEVLAAPRYARLLPLPCDRQGHPLAWPPIPGWSYGQRCYVVEEVTRPGWAAREGLQPTDLIVAWEGEQAPCQPHSQARTLRLWRSGAIAEVALPAGIHPGFEAHPTVYPLLCDQRNRLASAAELPPSLPFGSYLLLLRRAGRAEVRLPLYLHQGAEPRILVRMPPRESVAPGFVYVEAGPFLGGGDIERSPNSFAPDEYEITAFQIARCEVTFGEYLEALAWKEQRAPGSMRVHLPHDRRGEPPPPFRIDPHTFEISPRRYAQIPVCSIAYADALLLCEILSERALERGEPWVYELPFALSWEKAARGADGRIFPWGDEFDWTLCFGPRSLRAAPWLPARTQSYPGDESPYGLLGMAGNVAEFVYRHDRKRPADAPGLKGGGIAHLDPMYYRLPARDRIVWPSRGRGLRLVARLRDTPIQGRRPSAAEMGEEKKNDE